MSRYIKFYDFSNVKNSEYNSRLEYDEFYKILSESEKEIVFECKDIQYTYTKSTKNRKMCEIKEFPVMQAIDCVYYDSNFICKLEDNNTFDSSILLHLGYSYIDLDLLTIKKELVNV